MIVLDMDGTLLNSNGKILNSSKEILKRLKKDGEMIVINTGRSINQAKPLLDKQFVDYILCNNGNLWYSFEEDRIIKTNILDKEEVIELIMKNALLIVYYWIADENFHIFYDSEQVINFVKSKDTFHMTFNFNCNTDCINVYNNIKNEFNNLEFQLMQNSFGNKKWIDILPKNSDKGSNLVAFSNFLKVNLNDIICFGDGLNDISMLKISGVSVAMDNALDEVKNSSKYITNSYDDDGIYNFLNNYFYKEEL